MFGLGEQFRFCGLASFSQAAMLAYLQLRAPFADVLMQKAAMPMVFGPGEAVLPLLALAPAEVFKSICVPDALSCVCILFVVGVWAAAIDMPRTKAATAVRVVRIFISKASLEKLNAAWAAREYNDYIGTLFRELGL